MTRTPDEPIASRPASATDGPRWSRVLVFHIGSLGDTVMTVPALQALRAHVGPAATITLLHNEAPSGRVVPDEIIPDGLVDDLLSFPGPVDRPPPRAAGVRASLASTTRSLRSDARRATGAAGLIRWVRQRRFEAVVNLTLADRAATALRRDRRFFRLCGITTIVGFEPETPGRLEAEVRLDRLRRAGIAAELGPGPWLVPSGVAVREAERWRTAAGLTADQPIVTIAPGTLMDAKRWPFDRWAALGSRLRDQLGLEPVVVGGPADRSEGDHLVEAWTGGANAAGALSAAGSAALMAGAAFHIGVDTGTTHVAAASGTPVVALYSHRAPMAQWAPLGAHHHVVDHAVPCAGCAAVDCPVTGHPCMTSITLDDVWARVEAAQARLTTTGESMNGG